MVSWPTPSDPTIDNVNSSLLTVSTEVEWTSTGTSLNGPKVHPVNSTNFDWWYFDAVSSNVHGGDLSSIVINFYTASPGGIETVSNTSTVLDTSISGIWANGSAFGFDAYPSGAVIFTEGNSSDGRWGGYSPWTSAEGRTKYAIEFSDPTAGVLGYMILKSTAPPHLPSGPPEAGATEKLLPHVGWANAVRTLKHLATGTPIAHAATGMDDKPNPQLSDGDDFQQDIVNVLRRALGRGLFVRTRPGVWAARNDLDERRTSQ
ncbi:hypothetical protein LTR74_018276 [Friedmanniomyces endolithicus]|nr:hypothetical protein LTR74_018276 [Friedmanniomyces endolithicus]